MKAAGLMLIALASAGCSARTLGGRLETTPAPAGSSQAVVVVQATPVPERVLPQTRALDEGKPVKITSKRLRYDDVNKETRFSGDVVVTQDSATLKADELSTRTQGRSALAHGKVRMSDPVRKVEADADEAEYTDSLGEAWLRSASGTGSGEVVVRSVDPYGVSVTVTGQSAHYVAASQLAEVAGGVRIARGSLTATAQSATLNGLSGVVDLDEGVDVDLGGNRAQADHASLGGEKRSLKLEGHVRARFVPSQVREAVEHPETVK